MTAQAFRRMALAMGAVEGAHMNHPDFRAHGRIFATLKDDGRSGMVTLTPDDQARLVKDYPAAFAPESGAWGRQGCTQVHLREVREDVLGEAMTLAWRQAERVAASKAPKRARRRP